MKNLVIAKYHDGTMLRGHTLDIRPNKDEFHLTTLEGEQKWVYLRDLKSVFFVKEFQGGGQRHREADPQSHQHGRKITVEFEDGEQLVGTSFEYRPNKDFFFVFPINENDNNERILVNRKAARRVLLEKVLSDEELAAKAHLEVQTYKRLYEAALEIDHCGLQIGKDDAVRIGRGLKKALEPIAQGYRVTHGEQAWIDLTEAKLQEIRLSMGDHCFTLLRKILDVLYRH